MQFISGSIHAVGSQEAVAEVAMYLCQRHRFAISDNYSSGLASLAPYYAEITIGPAMELECYGIRAMPHTFPADTCELFGRFPSVFSSIERLGPKLSARFPDVIVATASLIGDAAWIVQADVAGEQVFSHRKHVDRIFDAELSTARRHRDREEVALRISELATRRRAEGLTCLREFAREQLEKIAATRAARSGLGFGGVAPHQLWSILTKACHTSGIKGMRSAMPQLDFVEDIVADLAEELSAAKGMKSAGWVDTLLFGDGREIDKAASEGFELPAPSREFILDLTKGDIPFDGPIAAPLFGGDEWPGAGSSPIAYAGLDVVRFSRRHLDLLQLVGKEHRDELAQILLASLSDPDVCLLCGLHPTVFLTASLAAAVADGGAVPAEVNGLKLLLERLAQRTPIIAEAGALAVAPEQPTPWLEEGDEGYVGYGDTPTPIVRGLLRSVVALVGLPRACPSQLLPAIAAGVPPDFLMRTLLLRPGTANDGAEMLEQLRDAYGSYANFPSRLTEAVSAADTGIQSAFKALRAGEAMSEVVATLSDKTKLAVRRAAGL